MLRRLAIVVFGLFSLSFCVNAQAHHGSGVYFYISGAPAPMPVPMPPPAPVPAGQWACASFSPMSNRCLQWAWVPAAYYPGPVVEYYPVPEPYYYHHHHHHQHVVY